MLSSHTAVFCDETSAFLEAETPEAFTEAAQSGLTYQVAPANGFERCVPGTGVLVRVGVGPTAVLVGVFVGPTAVLVGVFVGPTAVFVRVGVGPTAVLVGVLLAAGVFVRVGVLLGIAVLVGVGVGPEGVFVRVGVFVGPPPLIGVGATEQPEPFCQFWMLMLTVLALFAVTLTYIALPESLPTVKLLICAPLPLSVWLSAMQAVVFSLRPPYHLTVLTTVESPGFMTDHIAPRGNAAFTYLKQLSPRTRANEPPPVTTVGVAQPSTA
jgi:hypothetical protein